MKNKSQVYEEDDEPVEQTNNMNKNKNKKVPIPPSFKGSGPNKNEENLSQSQSTGFVPPPPPHRQSKQQNTNQSFEQVERKPTNIPQPPQINKRPSNQTPFGFQQNQTNEE